MPSSALSALLLTLSSTALAAFGPAFSTGPVASGNFIRESTSTLIVPRGNLPLAGYVSLWVGMGTSNGDLIQSILDRHPGQGGSICEDIVKSNQWCGYTYVLDNAGDQIFGSQFGVVKGDRYQFHYKFNDSTRKYTQYAVLNGKTVSTLTRDDGRALGWGTAVECAADDCGTVPAHQWVDTVITMNVPDPDYNNTAGTFQASTSGFYTPDAGKTWRVDTINITEWKFS